MNKMDDLLDRLASQQPKLDDADALCDSIIGQLPPQHKPKEQTLLRLLAMVSSIAAVLLLVLFIRQARAIDPLQEDPDYRQCIEHVRPDYSQFEDLKPSEALLRFTEIKRERTTLSQLKKNYAL